MQNLRKTKVASVLLRKTAGRTQTSFTATASITSRHAAHYGMEWTSYNKGLLFCYRLTHASRIAEPRSSPAKPDKQIYHSKFKH